MKFLIGLIAYTLLLKYLVEVNPFLALAMVAITAVYAITSD